MGVESGQPLLRSRASSVHLLVSRRCVLLSSPLLPWPAPVSCGGGTFALSLGRQFGEDWLIAVQSVNLLNRRFLLDSSNTFGGTHFVEPRQVYVELRYHFRY